MIFKLRPAALSVLLSLFFLFQENTLSAQARNITLVSGENMTNLYQLDTSGLGGTVEIIQDLNSIGSVQFISVLEDYKMNYVTRDGAGQFCCVNITLQGATASRDYVFTFRVEPNTIAPYEFFVKKGETKRISFRVFDDKDSILNNLFYFAGKNVTLTPVSNSQFRDRIYDLTGTAQGVEYAGIQFCDTTGTHCEFYQMSAKVLDTAKMSLRPQIDTSVNDCWGVYKSICQPIKRTDLALFDNKYQIDGELYQYGGYKDTCGQVFESVNYELGRDFHNGDVQYRVASWEVDGNIFSGWVFKNFTDLRGWMDFIVPNSDWLQRSFRLEGTRSNHNFGAMTIVNLSTGDSLVLQPTFAVRWIDFIMPHLPQGDYEFGIHFPNFDYTTTTDVILNCENYSGYSERFDTIYVGDDKTDYLFDLPNIRFPVRENFYHPASFGGFAQFSFDSRNRGLTYFGLREGAEKYIAEFCNEFDQCDTILFNIEVKDFPSSGITVTVPPEADKIIACTEIPVFQDIEAVSDCRFGTEVTISHRDSSASGGCAQHQINYRFWTLTDLCGNVERFTQKIETIDNIEPFLVNTPDDLLIDCFEMIDDTEPVFTDNCSPNLQVSHEDVISLSSCPNILILRTWRAIDDCGNETTYTQEITRINEGPFLMMPADPIVDLICGDTASFIPPEFIHECGLDFTVEYFDNFTPGICDQLEVHRIWTATDECGETTTDEQFLMYTDLEPPMFDGPTPENVTIDQTAGEEIPPFWMPTASDNCDADVDINFFESVFKSPNGDYNIEIHRTYEAMDDCGNFEMHMHRITVITDPVWPGDTDNDGDVDGSDLFPVGFAFGARGNNRPDSDWFFSPQASLDWEQSIADSINYKYIDSDGTGEIDFWDTMAIQINWGLFHPKNTSVNPAKTTEELIVEYVETTSDGWVLLDIKLGNDLAIISDFYGLTFDLQYNDEFIKSDSVFMDYTDSWAGVLNDDLLTIQKNFAVQKTIRTSLVRTDGKSVSNEGKIAQLRLKLKDSRPNVAFIQVQIPSAAGVYLSGEKFSTTPVDDEFVLTSSTKNILNQNLFRLSPNPTRGEVIIDFLNKKSNTRHVQVTDLLGKTLKDFDIDGQSKFNIDLSDFSEGTYLIRVFDGDFFGVKKVVKQ